MGSTVPFSCAMSFTLLNRIATSSLHTGSLRKQPNLACLVLFHLKSVRRLACDAADMGAHGTCNPRQHHHTQGMMHGNKG